MKGNVKLSLVVFMLFLSTKTLANPPAIAVRRAGLVEFRSVHGDGNVILKDIGKSSIIFGPESFESETFPPSGWSQYSLWPYSSYHWYRKADGGPDGSYVAWIDGDPGSYYGQNELLQTPELDFSEYQGCTLCWYFKQGNYMEDFLYVGVSTTGGGPDPGAWHILASLYRTGCNWSGLYLNLSPDFDNEPSIVIGFQYSSSYADQGSEGLDYIFVIAGSGGGEPNLKPYTPAGWSGPLVCSVDPDTISEDTLYVGEPYYLSFALINDGTADITDSFFVFITRNGNTWGYLRLPGLQQGHTFELKNLCDTINVPGPYTWRLVVDSLNEIAESNEDDNFFQKDFYWMSAGTPDIYVTPESLYYYYETTGGKPAEISGYWDEGKVSVNVDVPDFNICTDKDGTQKIELGSNYGILDGNGYPLLPQKAYTIAIPPGAVVEGVEVTGSRIELSGKYQIVPAIPHLPFGGNPTMIDKLMAEYEHNKKIAYSSDALYPDKLGEIRSTGGFRRYNLVDVSLYPFAYRALSGKLYYTSNATITVRYSIDGSKQEAVIRLTNDNLLDGQARGMIYNYTQAQEWYPDTKFKKSLYDYVIITSSSTDSAACSSLIDWKTSLGYKVKVVSKDWINTNYPADDIQQSIRNFLRDKYPTGQWGIKYVLLVGEECNLPMRDCVVFSNDPDGPGNDTLMTPMPTDLYYAELTNPDETSWDYDGDGLYGEGFNADGTDYGDDHPGLDYHADVLVGRIPWSDAGKIQHICEKTVAFEQSTDIAYKKRSLLAGGVLFYENESPLPRIDGADIAKAFIDSGVVDAASAVTLFEKQGLSPCPYPCTDSITRENIINYWNNRGIFWEFNHGWLDSFCRKIWATDDGDNIPEDAEMTWPDVLYSSDAPSLDDAHPATGYLMSCLNAYPEYTNNLAAALLYQGCSSVIAATRVSSFPSEEMSRVYYFRLLRDTTVSHNRVGDAFSEARNWYAGYPGYVDWFNIFNFVLFGDPSLDHFGCAGEEYLTADMWVHNNGDGLLSVSNISHTQSWLVSTSPSSFSVVPGDSHVVVVAVNPGELPQGVYRDTLKIISNDPNESIYPELVVLQVVVTGIEEREDRKNAKCKMQNAKLEIYPNPFTTVVSVQCLGVSEKQKISLQIYDLSGRLVKTLIPNPLSLIPTVSWDGKNNQCRSVPSGIYFVRLVSGDWKWTEKVILLR